MIKNRIDSVVNKSTFSSRMQDVKIPEHLKLPKKKDNMSSAEIEPKAQNKSKIKIRPPKEKINTIITNKTMDKFIDRNNLKSKNKDDKTGTNSNNDNKDTETNLDNAEINNITNISDENKVLINEYNTLLEANKKIFSELKGDKDLIDHNNSFLENQNHMMFSNSDL